MGGRRLFRGVLIALVGVAALLGASLWMVDRANERSCESMPFQQLRLNGINYIHFSDTVATADLADELGTIEQGLPHASVRCGKYTLKDGMGTPSVGSTVYSVKGHDPSTMVAVVDPAFPGLPELFEADTDGLLGS